jgi:uroporphyrinogen-III synthase
MTGDTPQTLAGRRIALTREPDANADLAAALSDAGARVLLCPVIRIAPPRDPGPLGACLSHLERYDWLVLTSVNSLRAVQTHVKGRHVPARLKLACVGPATADFAHEAGLEITFVPRRYHTKGLLEAFAERDDVAGARVLHPRGELSPGTLAAGLRALGAEVDEPVAYRTLPDSDGMDALTKALADGLDAVAFASPSAVDNAVEAVGAAALNDLRLYAIGPSTSRAISAHGLSAHVEAGEHSAAGLLRAILAGEVP